MCTKSTYCTCIDNIDTYTIILTQAISAWHAICCHALFKNEWRANGRTNCVKMVRHRRTKCNNNTT